MTLLKAGAITWNAEGNGERAAMTDEDNALIARFLQGDNAAFDTLFHKHQTYVYHIVYGIVGGAEEARDLTQEVFVQVYRSLPKFRHGSRFATWVYRIAVNRAVDAARGGKRWRWLPLLEEPSLRLRAADPDLQPEAQIERLDEQAGVQAILMRCSLAHRQILALRYYRELSLEEMAEVLGCSLAAAKVRLHRARLVFKQHYLAAQDAPSGFGANPTESEATDAATRF